MYENIIRLQFKQVPFESLFTKIKFLEGLRVTYVCFGECHSAAMTTQGHVVIWGSNIYSQRGKAHVSQNKPNLLRLPGYSKAQVSIRIYGDENDSVISLIESCVIRVRLSIAVLRIR